MGDDEGGSPQVPEWLPDGWIMTVNRRQSGKVDRYFVSPVSGRRFRSRVEVLRYLNSETVDALPPVTTASTEEDMPCVTECSEEDKPCDEEQAKNSPMWLPSGWILDIRTYKNGANAGKKYKCYIDPLTGSSFYTKADVFRYLKTGKRSNSTSKKKKLTDAKPKEKNLCKPTSNQKGINADTNKKEKNLCESTGINADSKNDILSLIETSPDGLPPGWIKELICRKNASGSGLRKDPYYTDPVSGYVFRSKKDVLRYIETGEFSKYAFKPKTKISASEMHSIENESPPPISAKKLKDQGGQGTKVKRRLFARKACRSNRNTPKESSELLVKDSCLPLTDRALLQCEQGAGPSYAASSYAMFLKDKQVKATNLINLHENDLPDKPLEAAEEEALDQVIEKLLDSVSKNSPGSSDGKLLDPVIGNFQNPPNMEWLEVVGKQTLKPADKGLTKNQSSDPVGNPLEQLPKKQNPVLEEKKGLDVEPVVLANSTRAQRQNGKLLGRNISEPNEMSKLACGKTSGRGVDESEKEGKNSAIGSTKARKSKAKSEKSAPITRRASKRLAGLEADPAADIEVGDKSLKRAKQSTELKPSSAKISLSDNQEADAEPRQLKEPSGEQVEAEPPKLEEPLGKQVEAELPKVNEEPLGGQVDLEEQGGDDGTVYKDFECPIASPFGDSWPDPCIEFAFKTLTGEIPVLDTTTIQGYLHEQLSSVQTPTSDGPHSSVGGCPNGQDQADTQTQVNSSGEHPSLLGTDMSSTGGKGRVKRLCHRPITRNSPNM